MRTIYVGFSKPKHSFLPVYSWAIRAVERTEFSHVYVWHNTKYNIPLIYQASGSAVNFMNGTIFNQSHVVVKEFCFQVSDEAFDKYMKKALEKVGAPYSLLQPIGIALTKLLNLNKNPFSDGRRLYVCSELVAEILTELMNFKLPENYFDKATPKDIYNLCERLA